MNKKRLILTTLFIFLSQSSSVFPSNTQTRMNTDIEAGKPVVIQVCVALADNVHQWIVPVPESIGDGQNQKTNLYWGARYGLKTYMTKDAGWVKIASVKVKDARILERLILKRSFLRKGQSVPVFLVADAWDGKYIKNTIQQFLRFNAGFDSLDIEVEDQKLQAGGKAHLIVYMGHNALMDYGGTKNAFLLNPKPAKHNPENDAIVLACKSQPYFSSRLKEMSAHPLVLTTGLMAPESYSLHGAINQWIKGAKDIDVRKAAARSYNTYQKTGQKAAEHLFGVKSK